ncbi:S8 family peptidase [Oceanobacillus salinisoli]|uniref:S8 family peptidase n=1 Tax=Oceanobacillus salinisoli TaxID=2678611 RepID=UPI0012E1B3C2|nr:S8 family peptidase [Oceanobacillus salinisoli]
MLEFSMIQLVRKNGQKLDKEIQREFVKFYRPFRFIPCFFQSTFERIRKKAKKLSVLIEFEPDLYETGINDVKNSKCSNFRELSSISCCSAKMSVETIESLLNQCKSIKKIHYDRRVNALLDVASPAVRADQLKQSGLTGKDVTIAIIDTGIHPHQDLENRIVAFQDFINNRNTPYDDNGHGTHCAGDAAGNGSLSNGAYQGPAPEANVVGVKVLDNIGAGSLSTVIAGIEWCIQNQSTLGIDVLSLSLGSTAVESAENDPVVRAVEAAWDRGMTVCVAAGNSGPSQGTIASPGISPKVVTVGAANEQNTLNRTDDTVASFSSRGPTIDGITKPDLITPGENIISLRAPNSYLDRTNKYARVGSNYFSLSGTSMSTPICAGVVAQLLERNPNLTPNEIKERLINACEDIGNSPNAQGHGYLDASLLISRPN